MTREVALERFKQEQKPLLERCREKFMEEFPNKVSTLMERINGVFGSICNQAEEQGKEKIVYFHFSLLRCDLRVRKYRMLLQVQDIRWFLDPNPLEATFSADFLFEDFNGVWDQLLEERKKYIGKVNSYDVDFIVMEEIISCNQAIGNALRYFFRDLEDSSEFDAIPKERIWDVRWGEYRGESVLAARVDRIPKSSSQWLEALRMDKDGLGLTESYWYQANLTEGDCSGKKLYFAVFEDCRLTNLDFKAADLTGARFRKCRIENCNFETANLSSAYFENCYWEDPNFKNAVMTHTLFTEEGIPQDELDEEQLGAILVKGGREL